ncbi:MAG TPA: tRNA (adenosine(37)-N6)-threonylcarbamoyltransferase complex ATPase subunit type 1 TsaE [Kiritimatiellia bacterium]|nr:tRNA (adenosine(37)-N6)-threonylcarbamoyltransferase complex ATPase subunit type 1 TsaE [Kiritimatiellia bacterium]HSA16823.1 tRNA (adenosine(37)-N6)-threonylcarbamoyltransferase complex ATPase subunit type 1 TsaE [Kiritimatiellia bacterium]
MSPSPERRWISRSPEETFRLAADLARELPRGAVLALHGELGAGKTAFVQGLARALGIDRPVSSPTFTLINEYPGPIPLYHIDLYRIRDSADALGLGLDEYLHGNGITAIEWAERIADLLPPDALHVRLQPGEEMNERLISVSGGRPS